MTEAWPSKGGQQKRLVCGALVWALAAGPVFGQTQSVPIIVAPVAGAFGALGSGAVVQTTLHPTLVGSLSDPLSPLSIKLNAQAAHLATLKPQEAAIFLAGAAQAHPLDAAAAKVLALSLSDPKAARTLLEAHPGLEKTQVGTFLTQAEGGEWEASRKDSAIESLSAMALKDPVAAAAFDGAKGEPSTELDGMTFKNGRLKQGKKKLDFLGAGAFGAVHVHPTIDGTVVKTVDFDFAALLFGNPDAGKKAVEEEAMARRLAELDIGPRFLGKGAVSGRPTSVRERVYGRTVESLMEDRRFGAEELALVDDLLRRMAKARIRVDDLQPRNIMLGTTLLDGRRRAYLVDGGNFLPVEETLSEDDLHRSLWGQDTLVTVQWSPLVGEVPTWKTFQARIDAGLVRSKENRWERFLSGLKAFFSTTALPNR